MKKPSLADRRKAHGMRPLDADTRAANLERNLDEVVRVRLVPDGKCYPLTATITVRR